MCLVFFGKEINHNYSWKNCWFKYKYEILVCVWDCLKSQFFFTIQLIFSTIHGSHCTFWYYSWSLLYYFSYLLTLSTVLSTKSFQFQLNKLFPNRHLMRNNWRKWLKQIWSTSSSNDVEINGGQWKIRMPDSGKRLPELEIS